VREVRERLRSGVLAVLGGIGVLIALGASLAIWYFLDKGADHLPGPLKDVAHQAVDGPSGQPLVTSIRSSGLTARSVEQTAQHQLQAAADSDPRYAGTAVSRVSCLEEAPPDGVDQRFSCGVWINARLAPKRLLLNVVDGKLELAAS
jgi:hypothetical protein